MNQHDGKFVRPFKNKLQYYVYAWFLKAKCIYVGFGHNQRCRAIQYELSKRLNFPINDLREQAMIVVVSCTDRAAALLLERDWIANLQPQLNITPGHGAFYGNKNCVGRISPTKGKKFHRKPGFVSHNKGKKCSSIVRLAMSLSRKGKPPCALALQRAHEATRNRVWTSAERKQASDRRKQAWASGKYDAVFVRREKKNVNK
jgi:hypothetical protein